MLNTRAHGTNGKSGGGIEPLHSEKAFGIAKDRATVSAVEIPIPSASTIRIRDFPLNRLPTLHAKFSKISVVLFSRLLLRFRFVRLEPFVTVGPGRLSASDAETDIQGASPPGSQKVRKCRVT